MPLETISLGLEPLLFLTIQVLSVYILRLCSYPCFGSFCLGTWHAGCTPPVFVFAMKFLILVADGKPSKILPWLGYYIHRSYREVDKICQDVASVIDD